MSERTEAVKAEAVHAEARVPYFGETLDKLANFAHEHDLFNKIDNVGRAITGLGAPKDGILPSVEFVNPKGEKEKDTPFIYNGIQYEIDDSKSDPSHLFRVDYDGRRDAIDPDEAARARAAFQELEKRSHN
jgi:hypothetical protein